MFDLFAGITTADPLTDMESARRIFTALEAHAPAAMPYRWGYFEPPTEPWTADTVDHWLDEDMHRQAERPGDCDGSVGPVNAFSKQPGGSVAIWADRQQIDPAGLRGWLAELAGTTSQAGIGARVSVRHMLR